jgi:copper oxidase (laccase) domain-containing protein
MEIETFAALRVPGLKHGFSTRSTGPLEGLEAEMLASFAAAGLPMDRAVQGAQPHGNRITAVDRVQSDRVFGVDALATATPGLTIAIRVADCGPVYFFDPVRRVIALAHSGRKGTEGNITGRSIDFLQERFDCKPSDLIVQLGPCIRPPHYEVDFAAEIGRQARAAGVTHFHDNGVCTACDLRRYYSYRAEKGQTGRMWAAMMLA